MSMSLNPGRKAISALHFFSVPHFSFQHQVNSSSAFVLSPPGKSEKYTAMFLYPGLEYFYQVGFRKALVGQFQHQLLQFILVVIINAAFSLQQVLKSCSQPFGYALSLLRRGCSCRSQYRSKDMDIPVLADSSLSLTPFSF